jgi:ABC-type branched-subunit amino acid transport system ATPase component
MTDIQQPSASADAASPDSILLAREVSVHFGGVKAVDLVSLEFKRSQVYGIMGANGSGKSTLLAALTRLLPISGGDIRLFGVDITQRSPAAVSRMGVARTFQTVRLLPEMTIRENIQLGADLAWGVTSGSLSRARRKQLVLDAIESADIGGLSGLRPGELSYGDQRRVEIARAIASNPRFLLLDEPTAGMNRSERAKISRLLSSLPERGLTQLIVEHDVQFMVETCGYLYAMNSGQVISQGDPREVVRDPLVQEAFLGKKKRNRA